jgi:LacI family transcriptional regulator
VNTSVSVNRMNGYLDALSKYGLQQDKNLIYRCEAFEENALAAIKNILRQKPLPDGIFFINDLSAIAAIKYMKKKGFRIPRDIRIAGFNDDPVSNMIEPSLTTVMQPSYEVGKLAMRMVLDEIKVPRNDYQTITLRTQLVIRESSKGG